MTIEYKIRPVTRYIVTRYEEKPNPYSNVEGAAIKSSSTRGEYENAITAYEVGYALCKAEHERLGLPEGDMGIIYPEPVKPEVNPYIGFALNAAVI